MRQQRPATDRDGLSRARYFNRQMVLPSDLDQDRVYFLERLRRHNRLLHGWGIWDDSLKVERVPPSGTKPPDEAQKKAYTDFRDRVGRVPPDVDPDAGTWLVVDLGYALTPLGDEIYVPCPVFVDTAREWSDGTLVTAPADCRPVPGMRPLGRGNYEWYLLVEAWEEEGGAVRTASARCGDHPEHFEFSRVADTVAFRLLRTDDKRFTKDPFDDIASPLGRKQRLTGEKLKRHPDYIWLGTVKFEGDKGPTVTSDPRDPTLSVPPPGVKASPATGTSAPAT
jgi:hypothetical protein